MIHLLCGAVGAGKTTYSRTLAHDRQALHLSIDQWMTNLFAPDLQELPDVAWMVERFERCKPPTDEELVGAIVINTEHPDR